MTENQKQYNKQLTRIKNAIKKAEKEGYIVPQDILPQTPTRITKKRIEELKEITPKKLRLKSEFLDIETGELITGKEKEKQKAEERKQARKRKKTSQSIQENISTTSQSEILHISTFDEIYNRIDSLPREYGVRTYDGAWHKISEAHYIEAILDTMIEERLQDEIAYIEHLQNKQSAIIEVIDDLPYASSQGTLEHLFDQLIIHVSIGFPPRNVLAKGNDYTEYMNGFD